MRPLTAHAAIDGRSAAVATSGWRPLSRGPVCGQPIGLPPPHEGYRLTASSTIARLQPWQNIPQPSLTLPIRLDNDTSDDLVGVTSRTPWAAVTAPEGVILAVTTGMRASLHGLVIPAGSFYDWAAPIPLQLCRDRPAGAPREYLSAGRYQVWVDVDVHPEPDVWDIAFTVRGGPFDLVLEARQPE
jgi:hypothetical protein